jgi:hypothetical protein
MMPNDYQIRIQAVSEPRSADLGAGATYVPSLNHPDDTYVVPTWLYEACVHHFVKRRIMGFVTECAGCESTCCADCRPELVDAWTEPAAGPEHPEWLQPIDMANVAEAIDDLEARLYG